MSGKRSLSILKSTQLTWSQISWEEENTLNSTQMTWRSRKILSQNSQIHTIDLESNKFRWRKHSEFHSNDFEIKKNPLNFFENNMSWEDFLPLKYLQVRWSFSQRFRVFFPRLVPIPLMFVCLYLCCNELCVTVWLSWWCCSWPRWDTCTYS